VPLDSRCHVPSHRGTEAVQEEAAGQHQHVAQVGGDGEHQGEPLVLRAALRPAIGGGVVVKLTLDQRRVIGSGGDVAPRAEVSLRLQDEDQRRPAEQRPEAQALRQAGGEGEPAAHGPGTRHDAHG